MRKSRLTEAQIMAILHGVNPSSAAFSTTPPPTLPTIGAPLDSIAPPAAPIIPS